jgi:hypothetical protein
MMIQTSNIMPLLISSAASCSAVETFRINLRKSQLKNNDNIFIYLLPFGKSSFILVYSLVVGHVLI